MLVKSQLDALIFENRGFTSDICTFRLCPHQSDSSGLWLVVQIGIKTPTEKP